MPMPYTLTRGPLLTLVENILNPQNTGEAGARNGLLAELRGPTPLVDLLRARMAPFAGVALPQGPIDLRLEDHWIGQGANGPPDEPTGYWVGYRGDVEGVLREGLIRAIEVSQGVTHDADPSTGTRLWPIQVHWKCPNPYFEVWVSWRRRDDTPTGGQVDVLLATPPDKFNRLTDRPRFPPGPPAGVAAVQTPLAEPTDATASQGMWLVAHEFHRLTVADEHVSTQAGDRLGILTERGRPRMLDGFPEGEWLVPTPSTMWIDEGEVVVVEPPSYAGGADPGRNNLP